MEIAKLTLKCLGNSKVVATASTFEKQFSASTFIPSSLVKGFQGTGFFEFIKNVESLTQQVLVGANCTKQNQVDQSISNLLNLSLFKPFQTQLLQSLLLTVSTAVLGLSADCLKLPVFSYIGNLIDELRNKIPTAIVINSGVKSTFGNQEFMLLPSGGTPLNSVFEKASCFYKKLKEKTPHFGQTLELLTETTEFQSNSSFLRASFTESLVSIGELTEPGWCIALHHWIGSKEMCLIPTGDLWKEPLEDLTQSSYCSSEDSKSLKS